MLRRTAASNLGFACLVVFFAGCTDNPLPEASEAEAGALPGVPTSSGATAATLAYAGPEHIMKELWFNGTYAATDSGWPLGGPINMVLQDRRAEDVYDVTSELPPRVPVMLMIELEATMRGGEWPQGGDIDLGVRASEMDFVASDWDTPYGGRSVGHVVVQALSGDPIQVIVFYGELDPSVQVTYTLRLTIMGSNAFVPPGAVVGLNLSPGDVLVLEPAGDAAEVTVFDPADDLLERFEVPGRTEAKIPSDRVDGEYVLVVKEGGGGLHVAAIRNHTESLRAIGFEWVGGVEKPVGGAMVRWSEDVRRPIVATGLWIHATDKPHRCATVSGKVMGPGEDELIALDFADPVCFGAGPLGFGLWAQTDNGQSAVREGTYAMEVAAADSVHLVAQEWYLHYKR